MRKASTIGASIAGAAVLVVVGVLAAQSPPKQVNAAQVQVTSDTCTRVINDDGSTDIHCPSVVLPTPTPTTTPTSTSTTPVPTTTPPPTTTAPPTTTPPSPTPTTTPPAQTNNCFPNPHLCGFPDATNTGVPANWVPIHTVNGDVGVSTAGSTIDGWDIHGCVTVLAANVTIRNSRINGGCFYAINGKGSNLTLAGDQISCNGTTGTGVTNASATNNITITRSDISGCENGLNVGGPINMSDSFIHALTFINNDATHTDGAQFNQGVGPVLFDHNTIDGGPSSNSAIIMWDEGNPQNHDVIIRNNILARAGFTLYCPRNNAPNDQILNNRFVPGFYGPSNGCTPGHATWSGDVLDATGAALAAA
jgi:hypothetical protein